MDTKMKERMDASTDEMKACAAGLPVKKEMIIIELEGSSAVSYRALVALADDKQKKELTNSMFIEGMRLVGRAFGEAMNKKQQEGK